MKSLKNAIVVTGGIGTGKSTVCSLLRLYGFKIIDADAITHSLLVRHSKELEEMFDTALMSEDGFDRKALGRIVFNDESKRKELEEFLHPKIKEVIKDEASFCEEQNVPYILDIPLYFESGNYKEIEEVVVVYAPRELQWERVLNRGFKADEIKKEIVKNILNIQMDIEEKRKKAKYVIDNSGSLKDLQIEVEKFLDYVRKKYAHLKI